MSVGQPNAGVLLRCFLQETLSVNREDLHKGKPLHAPFSYWTIVRLGQSNSSNECLLIFLVMRFYSTVCPLTIDDTGKCKRLSRLDRLSFSPIPNDMLQYSRMRPWIVLGYSVVPFYFPMRSWCCGWETQNFLTMCFFGPQIQTWVTNLKRNV